MSSNLSFGDIVNRTHISGLKSQRHHQLVLWPWARAEPPTLSLFPLCDMGVAPPTLGLEGGSGEGLQELSGLGTVGELQGPMARTNTGGSDPSSTPAQALQAPTPPPHTHTHKSSSTGPQSCLRGGCHHRALPSLLLSVPPPPPQPEGAGGRRWQGSNFLVSPEPQLPASPHAGQPQARAPLAASPDPDGQGGPQVSPWGHPHD